MILKKMGSLATAAVFSLSSLVTTASADWTPDGPIKMMIGFAAGGGVDTQGRLIAEELEKRHGWKIIPEQVTGKGGMNLMMALAKEKNDGTVIGMTVSETMGYNIAAATRSPIQFEDFTAIASTAEFQMGIVSLSEKGWKTIDDVVAAAKGGETIRFGVMSPKLADLAYLVGKAQGVDFNIVQVKGGKAVMNGLNAGDLDIGWVAGAQAKGVAAGTMVNLASGLNTPLAMSPNAPTMNDMGVGFDAGGYFMFAAPAGIPEEARQKLATSIAEIVNDSSTKAGGLINKAFGGPAVLTGDELNNYLKGKLSASGDLLTAASE